MKPTRDFQHLAQSDPTALAAAVDRVVVINDDLLESGGAAGIALASLRELRRRGVPVTLLTGDDGTNAELARLEVDVVSLGGRHILDGNRADAALRGLYSPKTAALLKAWIEANDTPGTVYHLHNWHKVLSPAAFVPLRAVESPPRALRARLFPRLPQRRLFPLSARRSV